MTSLSSDRPSGQTPARCAFCGSAKHVLAACTLTGAESFRREIPRIRQSHALVTGCMGIAPCDCGACNV